MKLEAITSLIKALLAAVGLFFVRKGGKDAAKAEQAENAIKEASDANKIHDAIDSDDDFNDRVSERFRR